MPTRAAAFSNSRFLKAMRAFAQDERGSTAIEYGLIAGIITIALVATLTAIGETLKTDFYEPVSAGLNQ